MNAALTPSEAGAGAKPKASLLRRILKWTSWIMGSLMRALAFYAHATDWTKKKNPAGFVVNTMHYLTLNEQGKVFISVWLPPKLNLGEKIPALISLTRYADQLERGWLQALCGKDSNYESAKSRLDAGFAFVLVQSPGSCQSSGPRPYDYPPSEVDAAGLAIDWIVRQPWSNQKVGAFGKSYSATTADMSPASLRPQLKAVYPKAPDFDPFIGVCRPGGVGSSEFLKCWGGMNQGMDANDLVGAIGAAMGRAMTWWQKILVRPWIKGLKHPEGGDLAIFQQAMKDHRSNPDWAKFYGSLEYRDTPLAGGDALSFEKVALYNYKDRIEKAQVNTYTRAGWMDAGVAEGALQKFLTIQSPQKLVLLPTGHDQEKFVNPYGANSKDVPREPGFSKQDMLDYFAKHLKDGPEIKEKRTILYYTYGSGTWRETDVWPPRGIQEQNWFFGEGKTLSPRKPNSREGVDTYTVDFMASPGESNRWLGQLKGNVKYGDRRKEDEKLLCYTSAPLEADLEVAGSPTVTLHMASTHSDGAFHVYFEDVAPGGRVSYLTEGILRAIHRKTRDPKTAPFVPLGVYHTYGKVDAQPLAPGEVAEIPITLQPISVVIHKGHRIRVAIAGHDAALKDRFPSTGTPQLSFQRNAVYPAGIKLPVMSAPK
jgi:putative CocE/NonD family hydrolase